MNNVSRTMINFLQAPPENINVRKHHLQLEVASCSVTARHSCHISANFKPHLCASMDAT